jgi:hypothetical protein
LHNVSLEHLSGQEHVCRRVAELVDPHLGQPCLPAALLNGLVHALAGGRGTAAQPELVKVIQRVAAARRAEEVAAQVPVKEGMHFVRARGLIRKALAEDGISGRMEKLVERLLAKPV